MSLNFFFPEKSPAANVDNAESPRGQPAKSGTTWQYSENDSAIRGVQGDKSTVGRSIYEGNMCL